MWPTRPGARLAEGFAWWNARAASMGQLALAALGLVIVTGVVLALGYDVTAPLGSLALLNLTTQGGRLVRGVHAWSSHLLVVFALLHLVEHLAAGSTERLAFGPWLRAVLSLPLVLGAALSGFLLKADGEGVAARQVVSGLLERVPVLGAALAGAAVGAGDDLQLVYLHHVATLTLLVAVLAIEHGRRLWPSAACTLGLAAVAVVGALALPPALHVSVDGTAFGPWYFVGLQVGLRSLARPQLVWLALIVPLLLLMVLPKLRARARRLAFGLLLALAVLYLGLSLSASWQSSAAVVGASRSAERPSSRSATSLVAVPTFAVLDEARVGQIQGHKEGCVACHGEVTGLSKSHDPQALGCFVCHRGDPFAPDASGAHRGMVRVPGNLDTAMQSCGGAGCHEGIVSRVQGSLMATLRGMIAVDREVFGEAAFCSACGASVETTVATGGATVDDLGESPADIHLRELCVSCHLGTLKVAYGPSTDASRGGGCAACHVTYPEQRDYTPERAARFTHPKLSLAVGDEACFGCHSRSGRISLSYAGWFETGLSSLEAAKLPAAEWRQLADGRVLRRTTDDAHHAAGMACIDCHSAQEVMGDGVAHAHEEEATRVRCETCHRVTRARSVAVTDLPSEARAVVRLRYGEQEPARLLQEDRTGEALTNAVPESNGEVEIIGKLSGKRARARPPAPACRAVPGHARLSCRACHDTWVARCPACHTQWDPSATALDHLRGRERRGAWVEYDSPPGVGLPAFGVLSRQGQDVIEPFAPGMIATLNLPGPSVPSPLPSAATDLLSASTRYVRRYALAVPHTTTRQGLSCAACHSDPVALGYGQGALQLVGQGAELRWRFEPKYAPAASDGLAADAWIAPFDPSRAGEVSRATTRSFNVAEQERILAVGACLGCHDPTRARGLALYVGYAAARRHMRPACRAPLPQP